MDQSSKALPLVILFVVFWSLEIFVAKLGFIAGAKILPFTVQASVCALLVIAVFTIPKYSSQLVSLCTDRTKLLRQILLANAIHFAVGSLLYCFGLSLTSAINVAFLLTLCTPLSSILALYILKEPISRARGLLILTLMGGAYILTTNFETIVPHSGDVLVILACFFWCLGNVLLRKILRDSDVSGEVVSLLKPIVGLPLFLLAASMASYYPEPMRTMFSEPLLDLAHFKYAALAGAFSAMLWIFIYRALKIAESAYVSMLGMATPVIVSILAMLFLGEELSHAQLLGGAIVLVSGFLTHYTARSS